MSNIAAALKAEIVRISRKEIKPVAKPLRTTGAYLRKTVAQLKKRIEVLESENKRLISFYKNAQEKQSALSPEIAQKARVSSKNVASLRRKLGLTLDGFSKLLGVSRQAIYTMEKKHGRLKLRSGTLANLLALRGVGRREAKRRLEEIS
ncbi:MAG: hypothetical protein PHC61_15095 [Chitinivibrionales bacterium]|nr:hypothetical protein [Chitinivibrionales bacterium]